ncbi:MAG: hypothetical protein JSU73_11620 [candidate division WOR-3 bacterium]|nr:MAG: hypothetical protein JSU73_11620 [candidate division WOR-3 bacterium]
MSWTRARVAAAVCLFSASAGALHFSGRYENQLSVLDYRSGLALLDRNGLRLELEAVPTSRVRLDAAAWLQTFHGATELSAADLLPEYFADSIPDSVLQSLVFRFTDEFVLDRAFVSVRWTGINVKIGKQPLAWGVGYVWNPTEIIQAKSFLDPEYERLGQNAVRVEFPVFGPSLQAMFLPGQDLDVSQFIARAEWNVAGIDIGLTGCRRPWPDSSVEYFAGGQFKGELLWLGIWSEGAYHWPDGQDRFWQLCAGADYSLPWRTYLLLEYLHNSSGSIGSYAPDDWLKAALTGQSLGQDYALGLVSQPVLDFHQVGAGAAVNLNDRSLVVFPRLYLGLTDDLDLDCYLLFSIGGNRTEFGGPGVNGGVARLTLHF